MEARRRLGKRHLSAYNLGISDPAPAWGLGFAQDLSRWQWFPPSTPQERDSVEEPRLGSIARLENAVAQWLDGLSSTNTAAVAEREAYEATQLGIDSVELDPAQKQLEEMVQFIRTARAEELGIQFDLFCQALRHDLIDDTVSWSFATRALRSTDNAVTTRFARDTEDKRTALRLRNQLRFSLLHQLTEAAILSAGRDPGSDMRADFLHEMLRRISTFSHSGHQYDLLHRLLSAMSARDLEASKMSIVSAISTFVGVWSTIKPSGIGRYELSRAVRSISRSLALLDPTILADTVARTTRRVAKNRTRWAGQAEARLRWLSVVSRLRGVSLQEKAAAIGDLMDPAEVQPSRICSFLVNHWVSSGALPAEHAVKRTFIHALRQRGRGEPTIFSEDNSLASLYILIRHHEKSSPHGHLTSDMQDLVASLGLGGRLDQSFAALAGSDGKIGVLASHNVDAVRAIPEVWLPVVLATARSSEEIGALLGSVIGSTTVDRGALRRLWHLLSAAGRRGGGGRGRTEHSATSETRTRRRGKELPQQYRMLVTSLAHAYAACPLITNRAAFRGVMRCQRFLALFRGAASVDIRILLAIARVLGRDAGRARSGESVRFRLFLRTVERRFGVECAVGLRRHVQRWGRTLAVYAKRMPESDRQGAASQSTCPRLVER